MERQFKGPITGYDYPRLNALLERLRTLRERLHQRLSSRKGTVTKSSLSPTMANTEVWEWTDYKNRPRKLVIHREVKEA